MSDDKRPTPVPQPKPNWGDPSRFPEPVVSDEWDREQQRQVVSTFFAGVCVGVWAVAILVFFWMALEP